MSGGRAIGRAVNGALAAFVHLYRHTLGHFTGGRCRFYPSCSRYALDVIAEGHAPHRVVWLVVRRLVRCHPFGGHGVDPAPPGPASAGREGEKGGAGGI